MPLTTQPPLSRRLTGSGATVISDQLSSLCLVADCQEVLFPRWKPGSSPGEKIKQEVGWWYQVVRRGMAGRTSTGDFVCSFLLVLGIYTSWKCTLCFPFQHQSSRVNHTHSPSNMSVPPGAVESLQAMACVVRRCCVLCPFSSICSAEMSKHRGACFLGRVDGKCDIDKDCLMTALVPWAPWAKGQSLGELGGS